MMELKEWEKSCLRAGFDRDFIEKYKKEAKKTRDKKIKLKEEAISVASHVAKVLKEKKMADKVFLFGSFARDDYDDNSDIDLYITGLHTDISDIYKVAEEIPGNKPIRIVTDQDEMPWIEEVVCREGVELF